MSRYKINELYEVKITIRKKYARKANTIVMKAADISYELTRSDFLGQPIKGSPIELRLHASCLQKDFKMVTKK